MFHQYMSQYQKKEREKKRKQSGKDNSPKVAPNTSGTAKPIFGNIKEAPDALRFCLRKLPLFLPFPSIDNTHLLSNNCVDASIVSLHLAFGLSFIFPLPLLVP
jgi:hypothetical protein